MKRFMLAIAWLASWTTASAQQDKMDKYIDNLMARMTLQEKIGQMNLISVGDINTGAPVDSEAGSLAKDGKLGAVLNLKGVDKIRALQQVAVEQSRRQEMGDAAGTAAYAPQLGLGHCRVAPRGGDDSFIAIARQALGDSIDYAAGGAFACHCIYLQHLHSQLNI